MNSRDYWKRRSLILEQLIYDRASDTIDRISALFDDALEVINEEIDKIFATYAKNGKLTAREAQSMLSVKDTAAMREKLLAMYEEASGQTKTDLWSRLSAPAYANRISRLQALRDRTYFQARLCGLQELEYVQSRLEDAFSQGYYKTIFDIQQEVGSYFDFNLLEDNQVKAALETNWTGENWSSRIWDNNQVFADTVQNIVTVGIMTGQRYEEMAGLLQHAVGMDADEGAKYRSARLVRTECNYVANQGHLKGYQEAEIEEYIFLATLDERTSEICQEMDQKRFKISEALAGTNLPPMHPNCRSTTMPAMSEATLAKIKRAARDPATGKSITVPGNMTYKEWSDLYVGN